MSWKNWRMSTATASGLEITHANTNMTIMTKTILPMACSLLKDGSGNKVNKYGKQK